MPIRLYGATVFKPEIIKQAWFPVTMAKNVGGSVPLDNIGCHPARLIDTDGDEAYIELYGFTVAAAMASYLLKLVGVANVASMHMNVSCDQGEADPGDHYNLFSNAREAVFATDVDHLLNESLWTLLDGYYLPAHSVGVKCSWRAADAHAATNVYVLGLVVRWL